MSVGSPPRRRTARAGEAVRASVVGAIALAAVLFPLTRSLQHDSFPLSNYPMFTARRGDVASFVRAVGVGTDGDEVTLPPEISGGTVEVIHAARTLRLAITEGRADEMCAEIASRAASNGDELAEVLVVTERYRVVDALRADEPVAENRDIHARCPVGAR